MSSKLIKQNLSECILGRTNQFSLNWKMNINIVICNATRVLAYSQFSAHVTIKRFATNF